jgi:hypothetical protein
MIRVSASFDARHTLRNCATPVWLTYSALSEVYAQRGESVWGMDPDWGNKSTVETKQNECGRLSLLGSLRLDRRTWRTLLALSLD